MRAGQDKLLLRMALCALLCLWNAGLLSGQTSWTGTVSTAWNDAGNWTAGIPDTSMDAILGNAGFTGSFQPLITAGAACKSLIIGGSRTTTLTLNRNLSASGNITINSNGTILQNSATLSLKGNWNNGGTYTTGSNNATLIFNGSTQSLGGSITTTFRKLIIAATSTVTLGANVTIAGTGSFLQLNGVLNPSESPTYTITGTTLFVGDNGILKVTASTFAGNYNISGTSTLSPGSVVEYAATSNNQTISNTLTYATLRLNGTGTKTLAGDLPPLLATAANTGSIEVNAGVLDMSLFKADRGTTVAGGSFRVAGTASVKIGGTGTFPANYTYSILGINTTVEYGGTNQTIAAKTYGNLSLAASSGAVVKTFPATAFTVAGNFSATQGGGTAVSFTSGSNLTIGGNLTLGTATTFNGGSFTHNLAGNFINNGTFTGSTSTLSLTGAGANISGSGSFTINSLSISGPGTSIAGTLNLSIAGDLTTTGLGSVTHGTGGTLTMSGASKNITGTGINLNNLTVTGSIAANAAISLAGNLNVTGTYNQTGGMLNMTGTAKTISGDGTIAFNSVGISGTVTTAVGFSLSSLLDITGSFTASAGALTFTGNARLNGTANLFNVTINGTSLGLASGSVLGIANALTITAGTLDVTSVTPNTVLFNGTVAQNVNAITYNSLLLSNGNTKTAAGAATVNRDFTIGTGTTFSAGSFTHSVGGNWTNNGTFTASTGTIQLTGTMDASITGAATFNILTLNKGGGNIVTLASDVNVATLNMTSGGMKTGNQTLNITNTRNGNGIILGIIKRTHAFAALTSYAFEGPDNTVNITGLNTISSITMTVTNTPVSDFPYGGATNRQYNISVTGSFGISLATLRLHYEEDELNGNGESTMQLWRNNGSGWAASGKLGYSTTANYIEQPLLLSIAGRWTLSDNQNVLRWNGSASAAWNTAANWTSVAGSPGTIPGATDIVQIGTVNAPNQPSITTAVAVKNIVFGSTQAATLTIGNGGSLTSGNINGLWSANAVHTINTGNQNLTVNGDLTLSDGTALRTINLNIGTGTTTISGSLTQAGNASIIFSGAGALNIGGKYNYSNGTFTAAGSTVTYNGSSAQTVAGLTYYHLTIQKTSGNATIAAATTIAGNLNISSGELDVNVSCSINGNISIGTGAILYSGNTATINAGGHWVNNGSFIPGSGTVVFNGMATQNIAPTTFNQLLINKTGTALLTGNVIINGQITVSSGNLDLATYTANRSLPGGSFSLANGCSLFLSGTNSFPSGFSAITLGSTSTAEYRGTITQNIGAVAYGHLTISNGGSNAKTLPATISVAGDLTINSGATLDAGTAAGTIQGNISNNGTLTPNASNLQLTGGTAGSYKLISGTASFNRLLIQGYYTAGSSLSIFGDLTINGGLNTGSNNSAYYGDVAVNGTLAYDGIVTLMGTQLQRLRLAGSFLSPSLTGSVVFAGTVSPIIYTATPLSFVNYQVSNTSASGLLCSDHLKVSGNFTVSASSKWVSAGNAATLINGTLMNNGTMVCDGLLMIAPANAATIHLGSGTQFQHSGTVEFGGTAPLLINGTPDSFYHVRITNTGSAGITPASDWVTRHFYLGSNTLFNAGTYTYTVKGDMESNGSWNGGTSTVVLNAAPGNLSASKRTSFNHLKIAGNIIARTDINATGDFTNNGTYDGTTSALLMTGNAASLISGSTTPSTIAQLTIAKTTGATTTLGFNISAITDLNILTGILNTSTFSITQDIGGGQLSIRNNAVLRLGGTNTLPVFTAYYLDTFSTIDYAGTTQTISSITPYGNLTISTAGNKTANAALHIRNDFNLSNGAFIPGSFVDTLGGNWQMSSGSFVNTGNTLLLCGRGIQQINTTGSFNHITINKPGGFANLLSNITINGVLTFSKGNLHTGSFITGINNTASVTGAAQATGWVFGQLQKNIAAGSNITRSYEVGDSTNYTPASITLASVTTSGDLTAITRTPDHPNAGIAGIDISKSVNRYWSFTNNTAVFTTASLTVNWAASDIDAGAVTGSFRMANYNGSTWALPIVTAALPTSIQASGLGSLGDIAVGNLVPATTWTGNVNTDWFLAGNWSAGFVPSSPFNVIIPTGRSNYPVIATGMAAAKDMTIQSGASVTVSNATVAIGGNISNSGAFAAGNGTVMMNGSAAQMLRGASFTGKTIQNLTIDNTAGVTLSDSLRLTGILLATRGNFNAGGLLTLVSTAAQSALIDGSGSGDVLGNVTMQRYLNSGFGYKYLSAPFQAATVQELADDVNLSASFPPVYRYDEQLASSGWVSYSGTSGLLRPLQGYAVNIDSVARPRTITLSGVVNNGPIASPTLYNHNQVYTKGFNLVGNPYPSPVNWNTAAGWTRTNIDNAIYYFNAGGTDRYSGTYRSYINGVSSDGTASNIIPAMQGFFVHVSNGTYPVAASLAINNLARTNQLSPYFHKGTDTFTAPLLRLRIAYKNSPHLSDAAVIYFDESASAGFDKEKDALKLMNTDAQVPSLYVMAPGLAPLSISAWPGLADSSAVVPIGVQLQKAGWLTLTIADLDRMPAGYQVYLYDAVADSMLTLTAGTSYSVYLESRTTDDRFFLKLRKTAHAGQTDPGAYSKNGRIYVFSGDITGDTYEVTVTNLSGQVLLQQRITGNQHQELNASFPPGIYIVRFYTKTRVSVQKVFAGN